MKRSVLQLGFTAALVCSSPSLLEAQVVQLRPVADVSFPTRFSLRNGTIHVQQKLGLSFGARMTVTFNDRLGLVTSVTYRPGYVELHGAGKRIALASGAHSFGASTGARYWLLRPGGNFSWELHSSLGLVFGGSPAYEDLFESSTLGAVLGSTLVYQVGRIVSLKLRLEERLFRLRFGNRAPVSSKRPLQLSFGLDLPFLKSAH